MNFGRFAVMTVLLMVAMIAGGLVATLAPPLMQAQAQELRLAPQPASAATVVIPSFADLVERSMPAVVQIRRSEIVEEGEDDSPMFDFFRQFRREPFGNDDRDRRREVTSSGSGFFFTTDGYVMTNKHVIEGGTRYVVQTYDERQFEAELIGIDPYLDLAVLKVNERETFPALPLGRSDEVRVGEWVLAIGNPLLFRNTVTVGIVSGKGRQLGGANALGTYIQTDAAINFGNSGGPLINARGEVVGINTAIVRDGPGMNLQNSSVEGVGFALPITAARRVMEQLISTGTVKRGYLGVSVTPLGENEAEYYGLDRTRGALVQNVVPGLPAERAGLRREDVILAVDGRQIANSQQLVEAISGLAPGDRVDLLIWRDKRERTISVTLEERRVGLDDREESEPNTPQSPETASGLGFSVEPVPDSMRSSADRPLEGVLITEVEPASPASDAGLTEGLIVIDINGERVRNLREYRDAVANVESGDVVRLNVLRLTAGGDTIERLIFFRAP